LTCIQLVLTLFKKKNESPSNRRELFAPQHKITTSDGMPDRTMFMGNKHYRGKELQIFSDEPSELSCILSGNDAITILEFIHRSLSCNAKDDFISLFPKIQELFSFDFACAMLGYLDNKDIVLAHGVNISFPEEWLIKYTTRNFLQKDVIVKEILTTYTLQKWFDPTRKRTMPMELISLCMDFNMKTGYTHGSKPFGPQKNGSVFSFASQSMKYDRRTEAILGYVTPHLHLALFNVFNKKQLEINTVVLSSREKEVLNWLKQGKSSWAISIILDIS
jgi:hypothetical protein